MLLIACPNMERRDTGAGSCHTWRRLQTPTAATSAVKLSGTSTSSRPFTNLTTGSTVPGHLQHAHTHGTVTHVTCYIPLLSAIRRIQIISHQMSLHEHPRGLTLPMLTRPVTYRLHHSPEAIVMTRQLTLCQACKCCLKCRGATTGRFAGLVV